MPKLDELTLVGVSVVSLELRPLRLLSTCQVVMLTPVGGGGVDAVTVKDALLLDPLREAPIAAVPGPAPVAIPLAFTVATELSEELQLACDVTLPVDPSL